jgi:hypothetical protein
MYEKEPSPSCWNCTNQKVLWISEKIFCLKKEKIVFPHEYLDCEFYERYIKPEIAPNHSSATKGGN